MKALSTMKSLSKNPFKNSIYLILLVTAFTTINLLLNLILTAQGLQAFGLQLIEQGIAGAVLIERALSPMYVAVSSLIPLVVIITALCLFILPLVNYIFCISRGYEMGVLRALGIRKATALKRFFTENLILVCCAIAFSQILTMLIYKSLARIILHTDKIQKMLSAVNYNASGFDQCINVDLAILLIVTVFGIIITSISLLLNFNVLSRNEPMKLMTNYK